MDADHRAPASHGYDEQDGENGQDAGDLVRVGDLAASAGLTVRALHHYEDIGLLAPARRSAAGYRLYGPAAVERLYRVSLLRRLGLSLDQIRRALDDPAWTLNATLRHHLDALDAELASLGRLRTAAATALADLADDRDATTDLLTVLEDTMTVRSPLQRRISILVCRDLRAAHDHLVEVFGLTPGELTEDGTGTVVHAELYAGDGVVWLHPETDAYGLASPRTLGAATATMAVLVDDVDEHHRSVAAKGGDVVYPPVDQPYGYREYGVRDLDGTLWSFMKPLEPAPT